MSLARAFTTRRVKQSVDLRDGANGIIPHRSNTTKAGINSLRHKISAPLELIHTTNMLSYNAPDLYPKKESSPSSNPSSSPSSSRSDDESDVATAQTASSTPPTSPDSPVPSRRSTSPEPNHLSCYFTAPKQTMAVGEAVIATEVAPAIPKRAPSHTKKSYDGLARHRSTSRMSEQSTRSLSTKGSFSFSRSSSSSTSTSATSVSQHMSMSPPPKPAVAFAVSTPVPSTPPVSHKKEYSESHPFGHELAQVSELAEEYGSKELSAVDQEEQDLVRQGLLKFSAEDYLSEIQGLFASIFPDARPLAPVWI